MAKRIKAPKVSLTKPVEEPVATYKAVGLEQTIMEEVGSWAGMDEDAAIAQARALMALFTEEDWVFVTADLLASNFALPWPRVMKRTIVDGRESSKTDAGHRVQAILDNPSAFSDAQSFWYVNGVFDCMLGNSVLWYMKANEKFAIIPAHEVTIEWNEKNHIPKAYIWSPSNGTKVRYRAEEIIHVRRPNPNSRFWGLSPFVPGSRSVLFNRYSGEFLNSFFEKGATPQMIVETEINNNKEAISTLAKSFELVNGGRKNQRRPLVLPKGAKVTQVSMTLADTKLFDFINQNREVILNILRIPKHAVGLQTAGSLGSEEHKTALRFMWQSTVTPMLMRYASALEKFFKDNGMLSEDHYIEFDSSKIEIANEDMNARADFAIKISKTHTINEIRRNVWGDEPLEGGDFIPGVWKDPAMLQTPAKKPPNDGGEQPNPDTMPEPVQPPEAMPSAKWGRIAEIEESDAFTNHTKDIDDELLRTDEVMTTLATELLLKQLGHTINALREEPLQKSKAVDYEELEARLEEDFLEDFIFWKDGYKKNLSDTVEAGYSTQLKMVLDPTDRDAVAALQAETATGRKAILVSRGIESFKNISRTTTEQIISKIQEGVAAGLTIAEITRSVAENFKELTLERAALIARNETMTALSVGQDSACKNAARVIPDAVKVWLNSKDARVRDTHNPMHGVTVKANAKFRIVGRKGKITELSVPRDPKCKGSPEEVIRCRCTVAVVSAKDRDLIKV
jgi:HK97 family phage portal protein